MEDIIPVIQGTELKLRMEVDLGDIYLMDCEFEVTAYTNSKNKITIKKENCITLDGDETACFVPIDTSKIDAGTLILDIKLDIPDDDFTNVLNNDGNRTEIYRKKTNIKIIV